MKKVLFSVIIITTLFSCTNNELIQEDCSCDEIVSKKVSADYSSNPRVIVLYHTKNYCSNVEKDFNLVIDATYSGVINALNDSRIQEIGKCYKK